MERQPHCRKMCPSRFPICGILGSLASATTPHPDPHQYSRLLEMYVQLLVSALKGGVFFCVDQGYVSGVEMTPDSGKQQGDALSPAVFSLLTIFLIYLVHLAFLV